jgi:thiol:disulfide interchange protein DsbA
MTRIVLACLLAALSFSVPAETEFREGEHYERLATPLPVHSTDKIEVVELFWYGCPHCFHFEPLLAEWLKHKPDDVEFRRVPAVFAQNWVPHARAFFAAQALGVLDKFHGALFHAIHEEEQRLFDEDSLVKFAGSLGIPTGQFQDAYDGFAVDGMVKKAMNYTKDAGITGVPAIIVNGKYRTGAQLAGGQDQVLKVVDFLVDKERAH